MTVIAIGRVHGIAAAREQLLGLMRRTAAAARLEPGCRSFDFAETVDGADEFLVVHQWEDAAALEAHYRGPAHEAYQQGLFGLLARPSELAIHHVAATERPVDSGPMDPREAD
ncbi:MAG TPA: putative quinol monooxygenase [Solirubrobacteraceae bacterium]